MIYNISLEEKAKEEKVDHECCQWNYLNEWHFKTDEALNLSLINRRMYIEIYSCPMYAQWRQLSRLYLNSHTSSQWTSWHAIYWRIFTFECGCTRWLSRSYCIQGNRDFSTASLRYMNKKHKNFSIVSHHSQHSRRVAKLI